MHFGKRLANLLRELVHSGLTLSRQPILVRLERPDTLLDFFTITHAVIVSSRASRRCSFVGYPLLLLDPQECGVRDKRPAELFESKRLALHALIFRAGETDPSRQLREKRRRACESYRCASGWPVGSTKICPG